MAMANQFAVMFLVTGGISGVLSLILMALSDAKGCTELTHSLIEFLGYVGIVFLACGFVALVFTSR